MPADLLFAVPYDRAVQALKELPEPLSIAVRLKLGMEIMKGVLNDMAGRAQRDEIVAMVHGALNDETDALDAGLSSAESFCPQALQPTKH